MDLVSGVTIFNMCFYQTRYPDCKTLVPPKLVSVPIIHVQCRFVVKLRYAN